jgi:large conductance mechanosensitive channel
VVKSFVSDILMPPLSVLFPINKNIEEKFAVLQGGDTYDPAIGYNTLQQAQDDGAVVMAYGSFINQVVSFVFVGLSLYGLAQFYQWFSNDPIIKHTIKCKYCRKRVNEKVSSILSLSYSYPVHISVCLIDHIQSSRCINCTSWLDGREDRPR